MADMADYRRIYRRTYLADMTDYVFGGHFGGSGGGGGDVIQ